MRQGRPRLAVAAVVAFAVGVGLMVPFESTPTRIGGIAALTVFVVLGIVAIADPRFLAGDAGESD